MDWQRVARITAVALAWGLASACATHAPAPAGIPARTIAERIAGPEPAAASSSALVLAIERAQANEKPQLIAHDVEQNAVRFRADVEDGATAAALGDVIWVHAGAGMRALDAQTGRELYRIALPQGRYTGAARAADRIAYAVVTGRALDPDARSELVIVDARSGARTSTLELPGDTGRPVAADGIVFVPSQRQRIIAIDAARGEELARLRAQSDAIEWLDVYEGEGGSTLLFGGGGFHRLIASDAQPSASFRLPEALRALPGRPSAPPSAYEPSAGRRIGLYVAPVPSAERDVALLSGRAYFVFYSQVFAFDARGTLVYARSLGADAVAARVLGAGLLVATSDGALTLLSHADGAALAKQALGSTAGLRSAELPARAPQPLAADSGRAPSSDALASSLLELAGAADSRLVPARIFAVEQLARMDQPAITGELLALYERPNTPAELQSALATALSARRTGLGALVSALERRYDFLTGARPAPLTIIAPAVARGGEKAAVPGLLERLWDHETPVTALPSLARALGTLGDAETAGSLLEWLERYRADSSLRGEPDALVETARAALALDGERARTTLAALLDEKRLDEEPAKAIAALIAPVVAAPAPEQIAAARPPAPPLPRLPSQRMLDAAFAAHLAELKPCVEAELAQNPKLLQVRIAFIAEGDGSAHGFHVAPASSTLAECLYPKVAGIRLPAFSERRSVEQVTISLRAASEPVAQAKADANEPWWAWRAQATRAKTHATPWWHIEQPLPPRLDASSGSALEIEAGAQPLLGTRPAVAPAPATPAAPAPAQPTAPSTTTAPAPAAPAAPATTVPAPVPAPAPVADEPSDAWWVPKAE
jgi:outer membrane protein assembly factor BamB